MMTSGLRTLVRATSLSRGVIARSVLALAALVAVAAGVAPSMNADGDSRRDWLMIGHDVENTRSQPAESGIDRKNVSRLAPKWVLTTAGDVSATPAVGVDDERGKKIRSVYFPDWGGRLWKVDADTGNVIWSRLIADYNDIPNSVSRTSPVLANGLIYVGDLNGNMMGVDAATGDVRWITELDPNPNTIVTTSPVILGNRLYISTSSAGGGPARQIFRGSMLALDAATGQVVWQSFVLPDNGGVPGGFAGGAFVNPPAIDVENGLVYGAAGQLYTQPTNVTACLATQPGGWSEACFPVGAYFNSVIAFDLRTGAVRWAFRGAGADARQLACGNLPPEVTWCAPAEPVQRLGFRRVGANVFTTRIDKHKRRVVGIGQKTGCTGCSMQPPGNICGARWLDLAQIPAASSGAPRMTATVSTRPLATIQARPVHAAVGRTPLRVARGQRSILRRESSLADAGPARGAGSRCVDGGQRSPVRRIDGAYRRPDVRTRREDRKILWRYPAGGSVVAGPAVVDGTVYWGSGYARTGGVGNDSSTRFTSTGTDPAARWAWRLAFSAPRRP